MTTTDTRSDKKRGRPNSPARPSDGFLRFDGWGGFLLVMAIGLVITIVAVVLVGGIAELEGGQFDRAKMLRAVAPGLAVTLGFSVLWAAKTIWQRHDVKARNRERHAARHDTLTGLINRAELFRQLEASLEKGRRDGTSTAVLFLDLDRFKQINDTLGHDAGDEMLQIAADRLRGSIRKTDIAARLGGDEFVVVCRGLLDGMSAVNVAQQISRRFSEPVSLRNMTQQVGTSIGVSIADPNIAIDSDEMVRQADAAMYKAKRQRGGYVVFDNEEKLQIESRRLVEDELKIAIREQQFELFYQPVVDVVAQKLVGLEALLRWRHPTRGIISPGEFLAIAEEAGQMQEINGVVLREACAQMALWKQQNPAADRVAVSVNLSADQLTNTRLPHIVHDVLMWAGIHPNQLTLEVSEASVAVAGRAELVAALSDVGVKVAIDSFLGDHLSLGKLQQLAGASSVKIGRRLIAEIPQNIDAMKLVRSLVKAAQELGLMVVAEGIENRDQVEALRAVGVDLMQGYLFKQPVYADLVGAGGWFERWDGRTLSTSEARS